MAETTYKVARLLTGQAYSFRVMAINKAGVGPASEATKPVLCERPSGNWSRFEIITDRHYITID